jgi:enoyl-CoA hydratase/carnithine racemase
MDRNAPTSMPYLSEEMSGAVLWLTLDRPRERNPLSSGMISALHSALEAANADLSVKVLVLTGAGPVFSAGHDLREMRRLAEETEDQHRARVAQILGSCSRLMMAIVHSPKPVIASVQGTATAAGCQLVSACDLALAADGVNFCTPGVDIGGFCTTPLVGIGRNMHRKHAMEMALTGDMIGTEEALRFGLINRVVEPDELRATTEELAQRIASKSAQGIRSGKEAFYRQIDMPLEAAFEYANEMMTCSMTSEDAVEGVGAFLEKRRPNWKD